MLIIAVKIKKLAHSKSCTIHILMFVIVITLLYYDIYILTCY